MGIEDKKKFSMIADSTINSPKNGKFKRVKTKIVKKTNLIIE